MMRLHRGKKVQFEGNARMPRRHDPMVDKLPLAPAAEMAVETDRGPRLRPVQRRHPRRDIGGMAAPHGIMRSDPAARRAMAGFAAHAVLRQETRPTRPRRSGMASQAGRRGSRIARSEEHTSELQSLMRT